MMQVENEVGVLGDSRDHSEAANKAFAAPVPAELTRYLAAHRDNLYPQLHALWDANGEKTSGSWAEVFGDTARADEIFMAWHYGRFVQSVAARGKAAYNIPMYVNTWLAGDDTPPGEYPSGGPEPWVVDVWKAAGSALDLYAPDLYAEILSIGANAIIARGIPLYMPETRGGSAGAAMCFMPWAKRPGWAFLRSGSTTKWTRRVRWRPATDPCQVAPMLARAPGLRRRAWIRAGQEPSFGRFHDAGVYRPCYPGRDLRGHAETGFGLMMSTGRDEFLGAARGSTFRSSASRSGTACRDCRGRRGRCLSTASGWPGRRLNGDENDQGKALAIRFAAGAHREGRPLPVLHSAESSLALIAE